MGLCSSGDFVNTVCACALAYIPHVCSFAMKLDTYLSILTDRDYNMCYRDYRDYNMCYRAI